MTTTLTVGELVAEKPARSRVFERLGIDFCCGGKKPLAEACAEKGLDPESVLKVLMASEDLPDAGSINVAEMTLTAICDHIEATHHAYLKSELPRLGAMVRKVAAVHGHRHPWMLEIDGIFAGFAAELESHMMKEEQILFPMIRKLEGGDRDATGHCGGVANPIRVMEHEHDSAGDALGTMRKLSSDYTPPADACNTFLATLDGLHELENDMHQHVHKENNVLFPRAIKLEAECSG